MEKGNKVQVEKKEQDITNHVSESEKDNIVATEEGKDSRDYATADEQ